MPLNNYSIMEAYTKDFVSSTEPTSDTREGTRER